MRFLLRSSCLVFCAGLVACTPSAPPAPPHDAGPIDAARRPDAGVVGTDSAVDASHVDGAAADAGDAGLDPACEGHADCDGLPGCEVALRTTANCMACGDRCLPPMGAVATCDVDLGCGFTCDTGFENCDAMDGNGCEINTAIDVAHCGDCGNSCVGSRVHVTASCTSGDCSVACVSGYEDCDGDLVSGGTASNGCEVSVTTVIDCGACGTPCELDATALNAHPSCSTGTCVMVCDASYQDCDGLAADGCETMIDVCP
jgi:hypothetical protein